MIILSKRKKIQGYLESFFVKLYFNKILCDLKMCIYYDGFD